MSLLYLCCYFPLIQFYADRSSVLLIWYLGVYRDSPTPTLSLLVTEIKAHFHSSLTFTVMLNFTGQQIRMWKIPGDRVSQRNSFLYSHRCIFAVRQCSLSIWSRLSLVGSSYTGLSWAALCPYLTLADIFSPQCWHKFLPTKQFKGACDKRYLCRRANILHMALSFTWEVKAAGKYSGCGCSFWDIYHIFTSYCCKYYQYKTLDTLQTLQWRWKTTLFSFAALILFFFLPNISHFSYNSLNWPSLSTVQAGKPQMILTWKINRWEIHVPTKQLNPEPHKLMLRDPENICCSVWCPWFILSNK